MVLNILLSPDAMDSMQWGVVTTIVTFAIVGVLIYFEYFTYKKVMNASPDTLKNFNKKSAKWLIPLLFLIILSDKVIYGFANMYQKLAVLESTKPIPLYQPMDFTGTMEDVFGLKAPEKKVHRLGINEKSKLNYPTQALSFDGMKPVNIFIVFMDSVRSDVFNAKVMPNTYALAKESTVLKNHFSGGNTTRFGIFSLFYGINSSYWFAFLNAQKGPVFFDALNAMDYQSHIFSATKTSWPEFDRTVYFNVSKHISDHYTGTPYEKDEQLTQDFIQWLEAQDSSKPIFSFLFLDAPHGYSSPPSYKPFQPEYGEINYMSIDESDRESILNQYKNATYYDDMLLGKVIESLKAKGIYDNSIIIVSSDHGQEVYEHGKIGHNSAYNIEQTQVPLIMRFPQGRHQEIESMSSHIDLVPTLLSYMGLKAKVESYSNGYNVLDSTFSRDYVYLGNWNENALMTQKYSYIFSNLPNEMFRNEIRSLPEYKKVKKTHDESVEPMLMKVLDENRHFIR